MKLTVHLFYHCKQVQKKNRNETTIITIFCQIQSNLRFWWCFVTGKKFKRKWNVRKLQFTEEFNKAYDFDGVLLSVGVQEKRI